MSTEIVKKWDLAKLELFAMVADFGSLTKVAATRQSAQPVISRQIAALERACGGRLFARTGRGMVLTELGLRILPRIKSILADAERLSEDVGTTPGAPEGDVRIGSLPSLYKLLISPLFHIVRERFKKVRLHVFEGSGGQIDEWISSGYVDIGLPYRYRKRLPPNLEQLIAVNSYLVGPAGDQLTASRTVEFAQLAGRPLVLPGEPSMVRLMLDRLAKRKGNQLQHRSRSQFSSDPEGNRSQWARLHHPPSPRGLERNRRWPPSGLAHREPDVRAYGRPHHDLGPSPVAGMSRGLGAHPPARGKFACKNSNARIPVTARSTRAP